MAKNNKANTGFAVKYEKYRNLLAVYERKVSMTTIGKLMGNEEQLEQIINTKYLPKNPNKLPDAPTKNLSFREKKQYLDYLNPHLPQVTASITGNDLYTLCLYVHSKEKK